MNATNTKLQQERNLAADAIARLAGFHDGPEILEPVDYGETFYNTGSAEYLVLTDEEADERAESDIAESLWAFNADFLADYMPDGIDAPEIEAIRGDRCEGANEAMLALVRAGRYSFAKLVREAIASDGRGHFLSGYDGEEIELKQGGLYWYGYRVN